MKTDPKIDRGFYITGWILIAAATCYLLFVRLTGIHLLSYYPPCAFHRLTGFYCPGCGGTRAVKALLHGKMITSFLFHPFVPYVAALGSWFMASQTIEKIWHHKIRIGMHFRMLYLWIGLGIILINWVVKNVQIAIFLLGK